MGNQAANYGQLSIYSKEGLLRVEGEIQRDCLMHRSIGALIFVNKNGQIGFGNAVLLSRDLVLTAAHNVFSRKFKAQNGEFKFYIGVDGVGDRYYEFEGLRYPAEFIDCWEGERLQFDYAIMKLKEPIFFDSYLPLHIPCPQCVLQKQLKLFGYPCAFQNYTSLDEQGNRRQLYQYGLSRYDQVVNQPYLFKIGYRISALPGMSGCPVIMEDSVIAIHVGGEQKCNIGRIIDDTLNKSSNLWIKELDAAPFTFQTARQCPHKLKVRLKLLQDIELSDYSNLMELNLSYNRLRQAEFLSQCPRLTKLQLIQNRLHSISLASNRHIKHLDLSNNMLQKIEVGANVNLVFLDIRNNKLQKVNVKSNIDLKHLDLQNNKLKQLDASSNKVLTSLYLSSNQLQTITLVSNIHLTHLRLSQNRLQEIDVRSNINLIFLQVDSNKLKKIDVSFNDKLQSLSLAFNKMEEIDLSKNIKIVQLDLDDNKLAHIILTISANIAEKIYTGNNFLEQYDFSFAYQQSETCLVQLICEEEVTRQNAMKIVNSWTERYSGQEERDNKCIYKFQVI